MLAALIQTIKPCRSVFPINLSTGYRKLAEEGGGTVEICRTGIDNVAIEAAETRTDLASLADGR